MDTKPNIIEMAKKKRHLFLLEKMQKGKALTRAEIKELDKFEGGQAEPGIVDTQLQVAKAFNVTVRTVQYWLTEEMPTTADGKYNLMEIQAWRLSRSKTGPAKKEDIDKATHDANFRKFKALLAELDYKKRMGELLPRDEVEVGRVQRILAVKKALLELPHSLAPQLVGLEARQIMTIIDKRIVEVIEKFSKGEDGSSRKERKKQAMVAPGADGVAAPKADNSIAVGG